MSFFLLSSSLWSFDHPFEISEKGYWIGDVPECHVTDRVLGEAIADFFIEEDARTVVDFGCGMGDYVMELRCRGIAAEGYDGNPLTPQFTNGICKVRDLSEPFQLEETFDWVMSLEVGEHLPQQYEKIFIENLMRHAKKGILLSWAIKNQGGTGHFNEQNNDYIKAIFADYGYINDLKAEKKLRSKAQCSWFVHSLMVFRKGEDT
jgi:cyclopropane fatty-acyl-phospholipid synthase-like methyltransferase